MMKEIIRMLQDEKRPSLSNIFYFLCFLMYLVAFILYIVPFELNILFFQNICVDEITNTSKLVITFVVVAAFYIFFYSIRKITLRKTKYDSNEKVERISSVVCALEDFADLLLSIISFVFVFSVLLQFHNTEVFYSTIPALAIQLFIVFKASNFIFQRFRHRNLMIIKEVLKKHPDFD